MFSTINIRQVNIAASVIVLSHIFFFLIVANTAFAQLRPPTEQRSVIEFEPRYPKPGEEVTIRVNDFALDLSEKPIVWYINGVRRAEFDNNVAIMLKAPVLGSMIDILAISQAASGARRAEATLASSDVDIIVEGDTLTPYFYKGKSIPSIGSRVQITAVPHLYDAGGNKIPVDRLIFRWELDGKVVNSGVGNQTLVHKLPEFADGILSITIEETGGSTLNRTLSQLQLTEPEMRFYEYSPLSGISRNAIPGNYLYTFKDEVTVRVEPYFVSDDIYTSAQTTWTLNGNIIEHPGGSRQTITFGGGIGLSEVGYSIQNLKTLLQSVSGLLSVNFLNQQ